MAIQVDCFKPEVRALRFFELEHKPKAVEVIAIADWASEFNRLSSYPTLEIPEYLTIPYYGSKQARGQILMPLASFEFQTTDVHIQSQAWWQYLCSLLQYWEDEAAISEGALFGGHIQKPSALVEYIIFWVNPGLDARFQIEWPSIMGKTPWLATQQHMSEEEFN